MSLLFVIQLQGLSGSVGSRDFDSKISYNSEVCFYSLRIFW